ncbi:MAG: 4-hydroxyphenylpyruvate dioxygenase [Leptolyngbyaceae cyanobacterium SM2_3_12]|nr:4-hydroxyphenylpyruvate dioxygenase [Leptolyngbyaceae cyanobacterium SM2_3_12]
MSNFAPMEFNHLNFYVDRVETWHNWFVKTWGGVSKGLHRDAPSPQGLVCLGGVPLLFSSPGATQNGVGFYLEQHPPGIGDVAFRVSQLDHLVDQVLRAGGTLLQPVQSDAWGRGRWCQIQGWGKLRHTLIESNQAGRWLPGYGETPQPPHGSGLIEGIDHAVLNVPVGQLQGAITWYIDQLGFQPRQQFTIDTANSGLRSQVLAHPGGSAQLPINEPATPNSQVQEFLDWNQGAGVQHVALHTRDILTTVQQLRQAGIAFLDVPQTYYDDLVNRQGYQTDPSQDQALAQLQILVDWEAHLPQARLLQTFTQPFLDIPTVFFELIQRQVVQVNQAPVKARGFGERNFQALFEAIEREQAKRGSLTLP